jgi:E3 ubiquitin-protein ligase RBBP6
VGAHWVQECPTQGDPAYDKKRVRPPVGIPMTRLVRSEEGGLVLPGGQTGSLIANEDAFAREILGLPTAPAQPPGAAQPPAPLLLDNKPAAEAAPAAAQPAVKPEPGTATAAAAPTLPAAPVTLPQLAGEAELSGAAPLAAMPGAGFFSLLMHSALLPRGPPDFLRAAFDRAEPMSRAGRRWGGRRAGGAGN